MKYVCRYLDFGFSIVCTQDLCITIKSQRPAPEPLRSVERASFGIRPINLSLRRLSAWNFALLSVIGSAIELHCCSPIGDSRKIS
jgi:hypothetical protein